MPFEGDNMMGVKRNNRSAALHILHKKGGMSRKRLSEAIKLTPAAITKIVAEMMNDGLLREGEILPGDGAGRREILVELEPSAGVALGVLLNLRQTIVSAVRLDGTVVFSEEIPIEPRAEADSTTAMLSRRLMELVEIHKIPRDRIVGLGLAVRGITSADRRRVNNSFGSLQQENYPLCDRFEALTGIPCVLDNNVRALFAAQMFLDHDDGRGSQFFLRCEYGIGAALSMNDHIWHGVTEQCAEIGHIPVIKRGGKPCSCGKSGCLETIASPSAIREDALALLSPERTPVLWMLSQERGKENLTVDDILNAACNGDNGVATVLDRAVSALGSALKSVIYLIDPGKIVLYGGIFENPYYLSRLLNEMREGVDSGHVTVVEKSQYNHRLEEKAAGLLAVKRFFDNGGTRI
jgi:predicted NBD/HSP70 family sugar kinase